MFGGCQNPGSVPNLDFRLYKPRDIEPTRDDFIVVIEI